MRQKLVWIPSGRDSNDKIRRIPPITIPKGKVHRLWILYGANAKDKVPKVPEELSHGYNAFLESQLHDYSIIENKLHYRGMARAGEVWALLIYKD